MSFLNTLTHTNNLIKNLNVYIGLDLENIEMINGEGSVMLELTFGTCDMAYNWAERLETVHELLTADAVKFDESEWIVQIIVFHDELEHINAAFTRNTES